MTEQDLTGSTNHDTAAGAVHDGSAQGVVEWVDLYAGLTKLLDRLLEERRRFVRAYPANRHQYLDLDEVNVLKEGRASSQRRLEYWRDQPIPVS